MQVTQRQMVPHQRVSETKLYIDRRLELVGNGEIPFPWLGCEINLACPVCRASSVTLEAYKVAVKMCWDVTTLLPMPYAHLLEFEPPGSSAWDPDLFDMRVFTIWTANR